MLSAKHLLMLVNDEDILYVLIDLLSDKFPSEALSNQQWNIQHSAAAKISDNQERYENLVDLVITWAEGSHASD